MGVFFGKIYVVTVGLCVFRFAGSSYTYMFRGVSSGDMQCRFYFIFGLGVEGLTLWTG